MKIGLVGYQGSGKSTLFTWLTGIPADPALSHTTQSAMAAVPDARIEQLCGVYHPKKVTLASLELVDTPGLSRTHEGSAARLAAIREAGALVIVTPAFAGVDPWADAKSFEEDLLLADLDVVSGRVERLRESLKKPRPNREEQEKELVALEPLLERLGQGLTLHDLKMTPEQQKAIRSFQLFSEKPRLLLINAADDDPRPERFLDGAPAEPPAASVSLSLQMQLAELPEEERRAFCEEMGVRAADPRALLLALLQASGQMLFFTAAEKEVRSWLVRRGATAVEAAGSIHSDLARGFIRAEVFSVADIVRLGSEREIKAHSLLRHEPKDYVLQEGDVLHIRFSV